MKPLKLKYSPLLGAVSLFLASAAVLGTIFFIGSRDSSIIKITDHKDPQNDFVPPTGSIFVDSDKESTLSKEELDALVSSLADGSVVGVADPLLLPKALVSQPGAGILSANGYHTSDLEYNADSFVLAEWTPAFGLPEDFSLRTKIYKKLEYKQPHDYAQFVPVYTDVDDDRPAIELYMGYLFIDNGQSLDVYSTSGNYLTTFSDTNYIPAYTRDSYGNPLFYRMTTVESGQYDEEKVIRDTEQSEVIRDREPHEKEETVLIQGKLENEGKGNPMTEEVKAYYTLSPSGYFSASTYNDALESRGLYFNYPAYYGITDSDIKLFGETYDKYKTDVDGNVTMEHKVDWTYMKWGAKLGEERYERAYNFVGGLACVFTEGYYKDGGMFFINGNGNPAFSTMKKYNNVYSDRYVIENYMPPISTGPESIGYFYYDHGLVRARFEVIDYWNYSQNNRIQVYSSEEVLLNTRGQQFPIPVGYDIKAYSNGMILLEKNGYYGFMDHTGAWIAEPIYTYAEAFCEGLAVLKTPMGTYGMIDTEGNVVLPFAYKYISSSSDGLVACYSSENGWEMMRKMTK